MSGKKNKKFYEKQLNFCTKKLFQNWQVHFDFIFTLWQSSENAMIEDIITGHGLVYFVACYLLFR